MISVSQSSLAVYAPERLETANLLAVDVDGTAIETLMGSENGRVLGFNEIIRDALELTVDKQTAEAWVRHTPQEIDISASSADIISILTGVINPRELAELNQRFVANQVGIMIAQIGMPINGTGKTWPQWVPGFEEVWTAVTESRSTDRPVDTGFLTHNYTSFLLALIEKTGITPPDLIVADEQITTTQYMGRSPNEFGKGSGLPLNRLVSDWGLMHGVTVFDERRPQRNQVTVIGDSRRDFAEADLHRTNFVLVNEEPRESWFKAAGLVGLGNLAVRYS